MNRRKFLEKFVTLSSVSLVLGESVVADAMVVYDPQPIAPQPVPHVWVDFPNKASYSNVSYNIRKDVDYFELRKYLFDVKTNEQVSDKYIPYFSIYNKKLSSYSKEMVHKFKKIPFGDSDRKCITIFGSASPEYQFRVKGFIIKKDGSFWTLNEREDMVWLFDKIDTEAELYQFVQMYNLLDGISNKIEKTSNGYDLKQVKVEHKSDKKSKGDFDEYTSYEIHTTYIYHIKSNGEFSKEVVSTEKKNETKTVVGAGFHGDPPPLEKPPKPPTLDEILGDGKFVTP